MPIGIAFWVLMMIWFVFGLIANWPGGAVPAWGGIVSNVLLFVLFALIGWHVFGAVLHG